MSASSCGCIENTFSSPLPPLERLILTDSFPSTTHHSVLFACMFSSFLIKTVRLTISPISMFAESSMMLEIDTSGGLIFNEQFFILLPYTLCAMSVSPSTSSELLKLISYNFSSGSATTITVWCPLAMSAFHMMEVVFVPLTSTCTSLVPILMYFPVTLLTLSLLQPRAAPKQS